MLRTVSLVLLLALGGAVPAGTAANFAELCCATEISGHEEGDGCPEDGERDCDCPLGCAACCAASGARAVAPASRVELQAPLLGTSSPASSHATDPPRGASSDILHVPKLAA